MFTLVKDELNNLILAFLTLDLTFEICFKFFKYGIYFYFYINKEMHVFKPKKRGYTLEWMGIVFLCWCMR